MPITSRMLTGLPRGIYTEPSEGTRSLARQGGIWQSVRLHVSREVSIQDVWPRTGLDRLNLKVAVASNTTQLAECTVHTVVRSAGGALVMTPDRGTRAATTCR